MTIYLVESRRLTGVSHLTELGHTLAVFVSLEKAKEECKRLNISRNGIGETFYTVTTWNVEG